MELTQGVRFDTLELSPEILRALMERNIVQSTPVQAGCIPPMLEWRDVIAKAPTGTGKTFAYGIPIVEHIDPEDESVQAVILAPTRELAIQITDELRILYTYKPGTAVRPHEAPHRPGGHGKNRGAGRGGPDAGHGLHP